MFVSSDDTNLSCCGFSPIDIEQKLNSDLIKTFSDRYPVISIGEHIMKRVTKKKVLGVIIDENLKWDRHNEEQCKMISGNVALLRKAKQNVTEETLMIMYNALVLLFQRVERWKQL